MKYTTTTFLGIARADLIEASTISNPIPEAEVRYPAEPYRPFELSLAQSLARAGQRVVLAREALLRAIGLRNTAAGNSRDPGRYKQPKGTSAWKVESMSTTPATKPAAHEGHGK